MPAIIPIVENLQSDCTQQLFEQSACNKIRDYEPQQAFDKKKQKTGETDSLKPKDHFFPTGGIHAAQQK